MANYNLTVRMGFMTADATNSKIIGTVGSEKLTNAGRMLLRINSEMQEIQCPWLHNDKAQKLLKPYKKKPVSVEDNNVTSADEGIDEYAKVLELLKDE